MSQVTIELLLSAKDAQLALRLLAGAGGLSREIRSPVVQRPGLALAGDIKHLEPGCLQVMGNSEVSFLGSLDPDERRRVVAKMCNAGISGMVVTHDLTLPPDVLDEAERRQTASLGTTLSTADFIARATDFLEKHLYSATNLHGVLVDVLGVGVLIIGQSGIGKSECALSLIARGHCLVADDTVDIRRKAGNVIIGSCSELIRHHMEIRGLGIINIKDLFGVGAVRDNREIDLIVELEPWQPDQEYDRLGVSDNYREILGVKIPYIVAPVSPGRDLATIIVVAARNHL